MRPRTGTTFRKGKGWVARITYLDADGKRKIKSKACATKSAAKAALPQLFIDNQNLYALPADRTKISTFAEAAAYFREHLLVEARYLDDQKIAGQRAYKDQLTRLAVLEDYFKGKSLDSITFGEIRNFRVRRLDTPVVIRKKNPDKGHRTRQRGLAGVNRELSLLRSICRVAVREGWMSRDPFTMGAPLIRTGQEKKRTRILSRDEERRVLAACGELKKSKAKDVVTVLVDTGMRPGELFKLRWSDVDLSTGTLTLRALNTKTLTKRQIGMTYRARSIFQRRMIVDPEDSIFGKRGVETVNEDVATVLADTGMSKRELAKLKWVDIDFESGILTTRQPEKKARPKRKIEMTEHVQAILRARATVKPEDVVFGVTSINTAWKMVREKTGLSDVRIYDLRHTCATRLSEMGTELSGIGRILGHTSPETTYRYRNTNQETMDQAVERLDRFNAEPVKTETVN